MGTGGWGRQTRSQALRRQRRPSREQWGFTRFPGQPGVVAGFCSPGWQTGHGAWPARFLTAERWRGKVGLGETLWALPYLLARRDACLPGCLPRAHPLRSSQNIPHVLGLRLANTLIQTSMALNIRRVVVFAERNPPGAENRGASGARPRRLPVPDAWFGFHLSCRVSEQCLIQS